MQTAMKKVPCQQSGNQEPLNQTAAPDLAIPESPYPGLPGCPASADSAKLSPLMSLGLNQGPFAAAGGDSQDIEDEISDCHSTREDETKSTRSLVSSSLDNKNYDYSIINNNDSTDRSHTHTHTHTHNTYTHRGRGLLSVVSVTRKFIMLTRV